MNHFFGKGRMIYLAGAAVLLAAGAAAQDQTTTSLGGEKTAGIRQTLKDLPGGPLGTVAVLVVALVVIGGLVFLITGRRRENPNGDPMYTEPQPQDSGNTKFEQLLAETQGLYLRVQGGESKGYFRKIERLARIFLERTGTPNSRQMSYEEIMIAVGGGSYTPKQTAALVSIFERCRQGSEHEGAKIDFTAAELIKDLRVLVKQAAEETSPKAGV